VLGALNYFDRAAQALRQYLASGDSTLVRAASFDLIQGLAALDELGLLASRASTMTTVGEGTQPVLRGA
jgi:hypothetical protein